ncbi:MAG: UDP-3-O-[3-hydroxymyristoyl] N-acetylglucosamine deacetylase [Armatimonadetes bacterium]|nr:UDP-3-O-[3-hydroxymyristoyl] N-acetylglucosamine deacetylase [Armatimonadota bacterium]
MLQRTLAASCRFDGVGIHSGRHCMAQVHPAPEGTGVVFTAEGRSFRAAVEHVVRCERCTTLGDGCVSVSTVEHLLAAIAGLGVDNLRVEVEGGEVPILDGSAAPFVEAMRAAGLVEQSLPAPVLGLRRPVWVHSGSSVAIALPHSHLQLECSIHFDHPLVGFQSVAYDSRAEDFANRLAPARTFGFWEEVKLLLERGLARGGDFSNALVIRADGTSSPLRFSDEPARHKCLDLLGDLALLGARLQARVQVLKAGHRLHVELVRKILEEVSDAGRQRDPQAGTSSLPVPASGSGPGA